MKVSLSCEPLSQHGRGEKVHRKSSNLVTQSSFLSTQVVEIKSSLFGWKGSIKEYYYAGFC